MSYIYNLSDFWTNIAVDYSGIKLNVTNGAGGPPVGSSNSRIINLQRNGTNVFSVDINGVVYANIVTALSSTNANVIGNGIADDTSAIQTLFSNAIAQKRSVFMRAGNYLVSSSIAQVIGSDGFYLFGEGGRISTFLVKSSTGFPVLDFNSSSNIGPTIWNIGFLQTGTANLQSTNCAINLNNCFGSIISGIYANNYYRGFVLTNSFAPIIENNTLHNLSAGAIVSIDTSTNGGKIVKNNIFNCGNLFAEAGIVIKGSGILFTGNDIEGCDNGGVDFDNVNGCTCTGNYWEDNKLYPFKFLGSCSGFNISDNFLGYYTLPGVVPVTNVMSNISNARVENNVVDSGGITQWDSSCINVFVGPNTSVRGGFINPPDILPTLNNIGSILATAINVQPATNEADVNINPQQANQAANLNFLQTNVLKWQFSKDAAQNWVVYNSVAGAILFQAPPAGALSVYPAKTYGFAVGTTLDPGGGNIYTANANFILRNAITVNNGAGASAGTLNNAPAIGNPTKWLPYDDNGTTRYIPSW